MAESVPLYDKSGSLRLWWIGENLWTPDRVWAAFIYDGDAFSARKGNAWLGPVKRGVVMDRDGRVILWSPGVDVNGEVTPYTPPEAYRPPRPSKPPEPYKPPRPNMPPPPSGGWSPLSLSEWHRGGPPREKQDEPQNAGVQPDLISFDDE